MQKNTAIAKGIIFAFLLSVGLMISSDAHTKCIPLLTLKVKGYVKEKNGGVADAKVIIEYQKSVGNKLNAQYEIKTDSKGMYSGDLQYAPYKRTGITQGDVCTYKPKTLSITVTHPGYKKYTENYLTKDLFSYTDKAERQTGGEKHKRPIEIYRLPDILLEPNK